MTLSKSAKYELIGAFCGIGLTLTVLFCGLIGYQTLANTPAPIAITGGEARAWPSGDGVIIFYSREASPEDDVSTDTTIDVYRSVTCKAAISDQSFDLPPMTIYYGVRGRTISRVVNYPFPLLVGTVCQLTTDIQWSPLFSMSYHTRRLPTVTFTVEEKPI